MNDARHSRPADHAAVRDDTIVALATRRGRAAVSVIRISGPDVAAIGRRVVSPWPGQARRLTRCTVRDPRSGDVIDRGLAVVFPAPASYTGEDVLEVHSHGGVYLSSAVELAFVAAGARPALPGEFTERALRLGKLDLIEVEAIGELINARTRAAHRAALSALSGALMQQYESLRAAALDIEALIAFDIDFPEEDQGPLPRERVLRAVGTLDERLRTAIEGAPAYARARDGAMVVFAGPPNAGKSSLLNVLIGEARAIVSDEPGTTRDAIEVFVDGDPWPLRYVDTAGLRDAASALERLGIDVSERYLRAADVVLVCHAWNMTEERQAVRDRVGALSSGAIVEVVTKSDLRRGDDPAPELPTGCIAVSSVTGEGVDGLRKRIGEAVTAQSGGVPRADGAITARQQAGLERARQELEAFATTWREGVLPAPVAATHMRAAVHALEELIGAIDVDDVLSRVFSTFCVGK